MANPIHSNLITHAEADALDGFESELRKLRRGLVQVEASIRARCLREGIPHHDHNKIQTARGHVAIAAGLLAAARGAEVDDALEDPQHPRRGDVARVAESIKRSTQDAEPRNGSTIQDVARNLLADVEQEELELSGPPYTLDPHVRRALGAIVAAGGLEGLEDREIVNHLEGAESGEGGEA